MKKRYELIIFDLDGTLVDTSEGIFNSIRFTQSELGLYPPETLEQMRSHIGPPVAESYHRIFGLEGDLLQKAVSFHKDYALRRGLYESRLYDGIEALLSSLDRLYPMAVATLKFEETAIRMLEYFQIDRYFDVVCGALPEKNTTKEDTLLDILQRTRCSQERALLVGDSQYDAIGAQNVGIDFLAVTYGFGFRSQMDADRYANVGSYDNVASIGRLLI